MKTIWKFPLEVTDEQVVTVPMISKFLCVQVQNERPCLWALVDPKSRMIGVQVCVYGTGNPVPDNPGNYVGTFQLADGALVFHVFSVPGAVSTDA